MYRNICFNFENIEIKDCERKLVLKRSIKMGETHSKSPKKSGTSVMILLDKRMIIVVGNLQHVDCDKSGGVCKKNESEKMY